MSARGAVRRTLPGLAILLGSMSACGSDPNDAVRVIRVPADAATVADAVGQAHPGDTIEIGPGTYTESVTVTVPGITIRGVDRNTVVFDGGDRLPNGIAVEADGVAVENLTVHGYTQNGVLFNGAHGQGGSGAIYGAGDDVLVGYRASYVTAYNNGLYGIYAFAARNGLIEHSYVSGHPDSGIYVGQCQPCNVVVRDVVAERNAIGYYGTNASGGVYVVESVFRHNRLGMTPNSQKMEKLAPQAETVLVGNLVVDNDDPATPPILNGFFGGGIAIGGGTRNTVVRNRVEGHDGAGIMLVPLNEFSPRDNRVEGNVLAGNAVDLLYAPQGSLDVLGNCFTGNTFATSVPADIERLMGCGDAAVQLAEPPVVALPAAPPGLDYRTLPAPARQPVMPAAAVVPPAGAGSVPPAIDVAAIKVPTS